MTIEEDGNYQDSNAIGVYELGNSGNLRPMTFEFTEVENQVVIKRNGTTWTCMYSFLDEDTFELDDTVDEFVVIARWSR